MADDWRENARCRPADSGLFDELTKTDQRRPDRGADRIAAAIAICNTCPVQADCLEDAVTADGSGVRGGLYLEGGRIVHIVSDRADRRAGIRQPAVPR